MEHFPIVILGAGQAGLSAAATLVRRDLVPGKDFVVLDANDGPGGAWRHRWESLTLGRAHGIHDLPGYPLGTPDPTEPARDVVPRYYGGYEEELGLRVDRPVRAVRVERDEHLNDAGFLITTETSVGSAQPRTYRADAIISATGTWDNPYIPYYPGMDQFQGRQLHTKDFVASEEFTGQRVLIVGAGASATQFILMLEAAGAETVWTARREPQWSATPFDQDWGIQVERRVTEQTLKGLPPRSVVANTGLDTREPYLSAMGRGEMIWRGTLTRFTPTGVVLDGPGPDGSAVPSQGEVGDHVLATAPAAAGWRAQTRTLPGRSPVPADSAESTTTLWEVPVDAVLWATGFRASLQHLAPLKIRSPRGGVQLAKDNVSVVNQPGLFLVGYGASASTIGATRAGRAAAVAAQRFILSDSH